MIRRLTSKFFEILSGFLNTEGRNGRTCGKHWTRKIHADI